MRRYARWLAVVVAVTAASLAGAPAPACACSCVQAATDDEYARRADLAFEGVVVDIDEPLLPTSGGARVTVRFLVEHVTKGQAEARVTLRTAAEEAGCGYAFTLGHRYRVYAVNELTDTCAGNRDLGAAPDVPLEEGWRWPLVGVAAGVIVIGAAVVLLRRGRDPRGL